MDDIITNATHINELRSEIAMDIIDNHTHSLKKLKKIVTSNDDKLSKSELNKLGVLYQTLKHQIKDFYFIVDAFKINGMKRPQELDYAKMKQARREEIEAQEKKRELNKQKKQDQKINKEDSNEKKVENNDVDLQGMDYPMEQPKKVVNEDNKKLNLGEIDLLGFEDNNELKNNDKNDNKPQSNNNVDILGIDLFVGHGDNVKVDMDDEDFFDMLANRKDF